jgi:hypothetical protein
MKANGIEIPFSRLYATVLAGLDRWQQRLTIVLPSGFLLDLGLHATILLRIFPLASPQLMLCPSNWEEHAGPTEQRKRKKQLLCFVACFEFMLSWASLSRPTTAVLKSRQLQSTPR